MNEPSSVKTVWFIRHAESEGNLGLPTTTPAAIPITERGQQQAEQIPHIFTHSPDLLVTSPYIRTQQTAAPTRKHFPHVPHQEWPVHEYTYLNPAKYNNTTPNQRYPAARAYWRRNDPDFSNGEGAESFNQFLGRIADMLTRVSQSPHKFITIFTHGWFLRGLLWQWFRDPEVPRPIRQARLAQIQEMMGIHWLPYWRLRREGRLHQKRPMRHYLWFSAVAKIPNGALIKSQIIDGRFNFQGIFTDHIPVEIKGSHWQDR